MKKKTKRLGRPKGSKNKPKSILLQASDEMRNYEKDMLMVRRIEDELCENFKDLPLEFKLRTAMKDLLRYFKKEIL